LSSAAACEHESLFEKTPKSPAELSIVTVAAPEAQDVKAEMLA